MTGRELLVLLKDHKFKYRIVGDSPGYAGSNWPPRSGLQRTSFVASNQDLGIIVNFTSLQFDPSTIPGGPPPPEYQDCIVALNIKKRTELGGYSRVGCRYSSIPYHIASLAETIYFYEFCDDFATTLLKPGAPKRQVPFHQPLPEARTFRREIYHTEDSGAGLQETARLTLDVCIQTVQVIGIVILDNRHKCVAQTGEPGEHCWFLTDCVAPSGATFNLITDGEVWLAVDRRSMRVTDRMDPKVTIDLGRMNRLDKFTLRKAIKLYCKRFT